MKRVEKCCCGCSLKQGTIIIGILYTVQTILSAFVLIVVKDREENEDFRKHSTHEESNGRMGNFILALGEGHFPQDLGVVHWSVLRHGICPWHHSRHNATATGGYCVQSARLRATSDNSSSDRILHHGGVQLLAPADRNTTADAARR